LVSTNFVVYRSFSAFLAIFCLLFHQVILVGRKKKMTEYNQKGVDAIIELQNTINSLGIPIPLVRKLNGIRNAIEMQVENYRTVPESQILNCELIFSNWFFTGNLFDVQ
jgi:hypothetical protein